MPAETSLLKFACNRTWKHNNIKERWAILQRSFCFLKRRISSWGTLIANEHRKKEEGWADSLSPTVCCRCSQTEGIIEYHNAISNDRVRYLLPLCYRCHMIYHYYSAWRKYHFCKDDSHFILQMIFSIKLKKSYCNLRICQVFLYKDYNNILLLYI
jgi:hypothetical protein